MSDLTMSSHSFPPDSKSHLELQNRCFDIDFESASLTLRRKKEACRTTRGRCNIEGTRSQFNVLRIAF